MRRREDWLMRKGGKGCDVGWIGVLGEGGWVVF